MTRIVIQGGRVIDPANQLDQVQDLYIDDGRIAAVGEMPEGFVADQTIDASGKIVAPGLIDMRARAARVDVELAAAVKGGVTTVCCPPDGAGLIDMPAMAEQLRRRAAEVGKAKVLPLGALTSGLEGNELCEMEALKQAGCVGVSNAMRPVTNTMVMRRAMEYAASLDMTVFLFAQDPWLAQDGYAHEGAVATRLGLVGIPECAESIGLGRDLMLVEDTGVRAHFCQLSTAKAVQMLGRSQHDGLAVTADVTTHHIHLTDMDVGYFNSDCHVYPPLRAQRDRDGLRMALRSGVVGAVCSDHTPLDLDAKLAPFAESEAGISGVETLLSLTLRLVEESVLSLSEAIALLTSRPASILNIESGSLAVGRAADVTIFDADQSQELARENMLSNSNTPFIGWELKGVVSHTLVDGKIVFERD